MESAKERAFFSALHHALLIEFILLPTTLSWQSSKHLLYCFLNHNLYNDLGCAGVYSTMLYGMF